MTAKRSEFDAHKTSRGDSCSTSTPETRRPPRGCNRTATFKKGGHENSCPSKF